MTVINRFRRAVRAIKSTLATPQWTVSAIKLAIPAERGMKFGEETYAETATKRPVPPSDTNPLLAIFNAHTKGPGIWKWMHYFDIYHRHLSKFRGREVHVIEIGVYSGGSLQMWRKYFGEKSRVYGIDIEEACAAYISEGIDVLIGDQSDRKFWAKVRNSVPQVDILIDDGGHLPEHQIISLEEMLPHIAAGGVYLCEDLHGAPNFFASYIAGLASRFNSGHLSDFTRNIDSIHLYPFVAVIEKRDRARDPLTEERHGTQWQPFYEEP